MIDWTPWPGGECPVDVVMYPEVEVRFRSGRTASGESARLCWRHYGTEQDIVAYRVLPAHADLAARDAEIARLREATAQSNKWLAHLAEWIDSYWQDGMRPDEWTMKEWAQKSRAAITKEQP